jgi:hypothetical protein
MKTLLARIVTIALVLALGTYLLDYLGRAWAPAATISMLSPFHYFEPMTCDLGGEAVRGNPFAIRRTGGPVASAQPVSLPVGASTARR